MTYLCHRQIINSGTIKDFRRQPCTKDPHVKKLILNYKNIVNKSYLKSSHLVLGKRKYFLHYFKNWKDG